LSLKDMEKLRRSNLYSKALPLLEVIKINPYQNPPPYEKLKGDLNNLYSHRINKQHRLLYNVLDSEKVIRIIRMWTHYE